MHGPRGQLLPAYTRKRHREKQAVPKAAKRACPETLPFEQTAAYKRLRSDRDHGACEPSLDIEESQQGPLDDGHDTLPSDDRLPTSPVKAELDRIHLEYTTACQNFIFPPQVDLRCQGHHRLRG